MNLPQPYYQDSAVTILQGNCVEQMRALPDESVHCCVTSPPYWGLRDYGVDGQIGLEKTPEEYVAKMVAVFREVRRVLRMDGTCWLNLGDSYWGGGNYRGINSESTLAAKQASNRGARGICQELGAVGKTTGYGLKPKDLCMIPARVALALQADSWWLRQDIIWHKPNPMPESVTDRCTKSHEYIFLLSKSERYFYDAEAIKEPLERPDEADRATPARFGGALKFEEAKKQSRLHSGNEYKGTPNGTRNHRSVWTVATNPYSDAHFATFPPDLIKPCILAGTSARGCCPKCGAPWERVVEIKRERTDVNPRSEKAVARANGYGSYRANSRETGGVASLAKSETLAWHPTCGCGEIATVPCTVLDPFGGSGTTGQVALELGRKAILIELNPSYCDLIRDRTNVTRGLALA